eukprot:15453403-Alexandrium_andersonii.AAC.1
MDMAYLFAQQLVLGKKIVVVKVASDDNPADLGTKSLPTATHQRHGSACNVGPLVKFIGNEADTVAAASAARA